MTDPCHVAVIDIGKTNAKVVLVDLAALHEIGVATIPNRVLPGPPSPRFDTAALAALGTRRARGHDAEVRARGFGP